MYAYLIGRSLSKKTITAIKICFCQLLHFKWTSKTRQLSKFKYCWILNQNGIKFKKEETEWISPWLVQGESGGLGGIVSLCIVWCAPLLYILGRIYQNLTHLWKIIKIFLFIRPPHHNRAQTWIYRLS